MSRHLTLATSLAFVLCATASSSATEEEDGTTADAIHGGTATTERRTSVGQLVVEPM